MLRSKHEQQPQLVETLCLHCTIALNQALGQMLNSATQLIKV